MTDQGPDIAPGDVVVCLSRGQIELIHEALVGHMDRTAGQPGDDYLTAGWLRGYLRERELQHRAMLVEMGDSAYAPVLAQMQQLVATATRQGGGVPLRMDLAEQAWALLAAATDHGEDEQAFARYAAVEILSQGGIFKAVTDPDT